MKKFLSVLVAALALTSCATAGTINKPEGALMGIGEARCEDAGVTNTSLAGAQVCAQILSIQEGCQLLIAQPGTTGGKPIVIVGLLCGMHK